MRNEGLAEVANPSEILLTHYDEPLSGIAVGAAADGIRPYLIEVQSLVGNAAYGTPQRSSTGFDIKRLNMLLAVLEKRVGMKTYQKDVFLNFAGGFKVADTGLDLAVVSAVISSDLRHRPLATGVCCAGEIGLSGEVRPAPRTYQRILEAARLGFWPVSLYRAITATNPRCPATYASSASAVSTNYPRPSSPKRCNAAIYGPRQLPVLPEAAAERPPFPLILIRNHCHRTHLSDTQPRYMLCPAPATGTEPATILPNGQGRNEYQETSVLPYTTQTEAETEESNTPVVSPISVTYPTRWNRPQIQSGSLHPTPIVGRSRTGEKCTEYREKHPGNSRFPG